VLIGKHLDKLDMDYKKGIKTLPVILGERKAKKAVIVLSSFSFIFIIILIILNILSLWALITLLAIPRLITLHKIYQISKPDKPPIVKRPKGLKAWIGTPSILEGLIFQYSEEESGEKWPIWPLWYVAWAFWMNIAIGGLFVLSLILHAVYPLWFSDFIWLILSSFLT